MVNRGEGATVQEMEPELEQVLETAGQGKGKPEEVIDEVAKQLREKEDALFMESYQDLKGEELIAMGYVSHEVEIMEGLKVKIRTVTEEEDLAVSKEAYELVGNAHFVSESISRMVLARALVTINGVEFGTDVEDRFKKIGKFGKAIKLSIFEEWRKMNKALTIKIKGYSGNSLEHLLIGRDSI